MDVYVLGYAVHPAAVRLSGKRLEEVVFDTARAALDSAQIARRDLQGVTIAGCDELDGRSISGMLLAAPAGAHLRDEIKCANGGLDALILGAARAAAGSSDPGIVVSWSKTSEAPVEDVMRMRCEPFFTRPVGLNMTIADGLFAQAVSKAFGLSEAEVAAAAAAARSRAVGHPGAVPSPLTNADIIAGTPYLAAPLREGHCAPLTDGAAAFVLVSGEWLRRRPALRPLARIAGVGSRMERYELGFERLSGLSGFRGAFSAALGRAGLEQLGQLAAIEIDAPTAYHDLAFRRALPAAAPESISRSGGCFAQHPYFCMGLINAAEAIVPRGGRLQAGSFAAAHECHGFAQQGHAVVIFEGV